MWNALLNEREHRPWPLPSRPYRMTMTWQSLLFAHWPLPAETIRPLIPGALELETFDGHAWIGVVPFAMRNVGLRGAPKAPWVSAFLELNVRTYVTAGGIPGVVFFSLDAANPVAVRVARRWFHLPYFNARMRMRAEGEWIVYESERTHRGIPTGNFSGRYRPIGDVYRASSGTLDHWLTERYCLYAVDPRGAAYRGEIHHRRWPLQPAEAEIEVNTVADAHGFRLPETPPLLHFAKSIDVVAWSPTVV
jgi:uncharacterized protein YqjF (DUF2071 family)